jgi:hypothetical protein
MNEEISQIRKEMQELWECLKNKEDRKYPTREWHKRKNKILLK